MPTDLHGKRGSSQSGCQVVQDSDRRHSKLVDRFAFVTPPVVALDIPRIALLGYEDAVVSQPVGFDDLLYPASVKLQIAFPDPLLLQYDCRKLQNLAEKRKLVAAIGSDTFALFLSLLLRSIHFHNT